jgi:hypothetical protein
MLCALGIACVGAPGCKRHTAAPASSSAPVTSASAPAGEPTHCRRRPEFAISLEAGPARSKRDDPLVDDDDDAALLPFGVDIGAALATPFGFAVAGVRGEGQAFVALLAERSSRQVDLGVVHGDPETPAIAAAGERVIVALRSTDAAGFTLKLGRIGGPESSAVEWGYELSKLGRTVTGVELAADAKHGLLVFQGEVKGEARLMLGSFSTADLTLPLTVKPLEARDVEMPRLVRRPGGYWLSWVRTLPEPKKAAPVSSTRTEPDP